MGIKIQLKLLKKTFLCALKVSFPLYSNYAFAEVESHSYAMFEKMILTLYVFLST